MFIDASVLTAILAVEIDGPEFASRIGRSKIRLTSGMAAWETCVAVARIFRVSLPNAQRELDGLIVHLGADIAPITMSTARLALAAHERYGKGRHPAGLNFGDCFAYACARERRLPLLYKGGEFALTDIEAA